MGFNIRYWDGIKDECNYQDKDEAIKYACRGLSAWMNKGDRVAVSHGDPVTLCRIVVDGEYADPWAKVVKQY